MDRASWGLLKEMERATSTFDVQRADGASEVRVAGELDVASASELHRTLRAELAAGMDQVVLDLSAVAFMDSSALRALLSVLNDGDAGRRLVVRRPSPPVERLLAVTGLGDVVPVER